MDQSAILDASFRGIPFDCVAASVPTKRALAVHEYPFKDGGEVDDMGRRARTFPVQAIFFGDTYLQEMEAFIEALDQGGEGELVHPIYGAHTVMVQEYETKHEADRPDSCALSITFVESGLHTPFFSGAATAKGAAENAADGALSALDAAREAYGDGLDAWVKDFLKDNPATGTLAAVSDIFTAGARIMDDVINAVDTVVSFLDFPRAFVGGLESMYAKARQVANLGGGVSERFTGWQRLSDFCKGVSAGGKTGAKTYAVAPSPASVTPSTLLELAEESALTDGTESGGAASGSVMAAPSSPLTEDAVTATPEGEAQALVSVGHAVAQAGEVAGAACDILLDEADAPTLNPAEVEAMVGNARERIKDAMALARAALPPHRARPVVENLRDAAEQVQALGAAVINARPPLITHTLETDCNAHLLAHALYNDHSRAPEILRLNPGIKNPNFLKRGQRITVYAE